MSQTIELESIRRLDIKPGEILVARVPEDCTVAMARQVKAQLVDCLPDNVEVIVTNSIDLDVLSCPPSPACPADT
jgi:hypothetical protein